MALVPALSTNKALAKLTIIPFSTTRVGMWVPNGVPFIAMYNPSTFSKNVAHGLAEKPTTNNLPGAIEIKPEYNETIKLDLILDATGASPAGGFVGAALSKGAKLLGGVDILVANFMATTKGFDPDSHNPNFLRLIWGAGLFFECILDSATVTYSLFNRTGRPIRATISATFKEAPSVTALAKYKNFFSSPDVTKEYIVLAGDTIYNIANRFYEDESFYLQIAEANDLKNYRRLVPGTKLILPPVQKAEE